MRESWFTNIKSARTVDDIFNLCSSSDDDILPTLHHGQSATVDCETPSDRSWCDADDDQTQKTSPTVFEDSCDTSESTHTEPSEYKSEEDSFYSMDSADQDAHPLLLSMPMIPRIKLQRKATVRTPDPVLPLDDVQNSCFLSPRIRDLRTPARMSSRRYGRILARTSPPTGISDTTLAGHGALRFEAPRRSGSKLACARSVSEPMLSSACLPDDEEQPLLKKGINESPHSDVLLSMIDEVGSSSGPHGDAQETDIGKFPRTKQERSHRRSSMSLSISFSSIIHAVADGRATLDLLLRKPKTKPKSTPEPKPDDHVSDPHDPTSKWAPKQGQIVIKVFVPSTDDIWKFRVPEDISLADFRSRVMHKLGFSVSFSGSLWDEPKYYFRTDERFKSWVKGRIRFGRNLPIVAHVPPSLPLVRLSVDGDGCEVWCYA